MDYTEQKLSSRVEYQGKIITLTVDKVRLPGGGESTREVVHHNGGVAVLAIDDRNRVLFVRQYRYPYGKVLLELPAGKLEKGEDPADCGLRELEEETGYTAEDYRLLGQVYPTPGYVTEVLHLYLARKLVHRGQKLDPDEFLEVEAIPMERALELCLSGEIADAKTLVSLLKYNELLRRGVL